MGNPVATNIMINGARAYVAPVGTALPDESVAFDTAWGGSWARVGYTASELVMKYEDERADYEVEELLTPIMRVRIAETLELETTLAELTGEYLAMAIGSGTVTTTAAGAAQLGYEELKIGGARLLTERAWGFEGLQLGANGMKRPVRVLVHKANARLNGELKFSRRAGEYPGIPLQIQALADEGKPEGEQLFLFQRVTAAATS